MIFVIGISLLFAVFFWPNILLRVLEKKLFVVEFPMKYIENSSLEKLKARKVTRGFYQCPRTGSFDEKFAGNGDVTTLYFGYKVEEKRQG